MKVRYLATFNDDSYYGFGGFERMDAFSSIKSARSSLFSRYCGSDVVTEYRENDDQLHVLWSSNNHALFPSVTTNATMYLYEVVEGENGQLLVGADPSLRLSFGPRMGVKVEKF